ncbi:serine/threonine-protein kinase [Kitasatospora sp. NPDC048365]|uniref:serine/threonine-protein kinase n=1 Tax=Kitasatospora sp. NPDC048365 TaxID=3364050 RepID=UPI003715F5F0
MPPTQPTPQDARWELPDYAHERELGAGASGRVVLARHLATGTPVAIKYLTAAGSEHAAFRTEAQLLATLDSPHVTRLYEYVEGPHGAAIVMELVDGISLRDLLNAEGATGPEAALTVLKGSLLGLAAAHSAGVVHRDYKPGNVLVTVDGESKLVDFGIAVRSGEKDTVVAGTPAYMAPEQWAGQPASPATDVYAATATFFECLTGAKPYAGTTVLELAVQHTEAEIPDTEAPEALRPLIRAGLAKAAEQRPEGAEALVAQLEAVAGAAYGEDWEERGRRKLAALVAVLPLLLPGAGGEPAAGGTSFATTVLPPGAQPGPGGGTGLPRVGRRVPLIGAGVALVLIAGGIAGVAVAGSHASDSTTKVAAPELTTTFGAPLPTDSPTATDSAAPSPSASASPSDSASASPSASASTSPTSLPSASPKAPPTTSAPTTTPPAPPTTTPPTTTAPPPTPAVTSIAISTTCKGYTLVATVTGSITPAGSVPANITFYVPLGAGQKVLHVTPVTLTAIRGGRFTATAEWSFSDYVGYTWGASVAAATKGQNASTTNSCTVIR